MPGIISINLKVLILDSDFYALQAINSYLAWDRRTRVTFLAQSVEAMWEYFDQTPLAELPDVVVIDADHVGGPELLRETILNLRKRVSQIRVVCLSQFINTQLVEAAAEVDANAYLLK